jgi:subtilisin-like proprotein convertase family protein
MGVWSAKNYSGPEFPALFGLASCVLLACSDRTPSASRPAERVHAVFGQAPASEIEPNGDSMHATNLGDEAVIRANVRPHGDEDFYRFTAGAGDRIFAATQTASSSATDDVFPPDFVREIPPDSVLDIIDTNGTSVLETDNDNGFMAGHSSSIAGFRVPAQGTYYVRVRKNGGGELRPYDLHFRRREGSPAAEVEPNDDIALAKPLPASGWVSGSIAASDDVDVYSLGIGSGSIVFASLDLDPERDGVEWDGVLELGTFEGSFLRVNDQAGPDDAPSSEALFATVRDTSDYYYLRVSSAGAAGGSYALSVSVKPKNFQCEGWEQATSQDVPKQIPDGPGRVTSTLTLGRNAIIQDLDIGIELTHSHPEDLDIHLISPAGNDNVLFTDVGSDAFPHIDITIDDEASFPLTPAADPHFAFTGQTALSKLVVQPEVSNTAWYRTATRLSWFDGEDVAGTWTLVIDDDSPGNGGTLQGWGIRVCPMPVLTCPDNDPMFALDATFETGDHGFTHSGDDDPDNDPDNDQWSLGALEPHLGFNGCYRGNQCWKTNASGAYAANSKQNLRSPEIDLTNAVPPIRLSWAMKYQLESATYDHAWVEVREAGVDSPQRLWEFADATMWEFVGDETAPELIHESAGWGVRTVDLSAYAGKRIELAFHLDSDSFVELAGLAIDDVKLTHCGCGDGVVAAGEQCDDGPRNGAYGGCCNGSCQALSTGIGCSDGSACTYDEICTNGVCGGGKPVNCNDANLCTDDSCNPNSGCLNDFNTDPCPIGTCREGRCSVGGTGGSGGASGAGAGGTDDGGEGGSTEAGAGGRAQGGTDPGGEGGEATGGRARGGSSTGGTSGTSSDLGGEGGEGVGGTRRRIPRASADSGCGCRVPGERKHSDLPALLVFALGLGVAARRRRSRAEN